MADEIDYMFDLKEIASYQSLDSNYMICEYQVLNSTALISYIICILSIHPIRDYLNYRAQAHPTLTFDFNKYHDFTAIGISSTMTGIWMGDLLNLVDLIEDDNSVLLSGTYSNNLVKLMDCVNTELKFQTVTSLEFTECFRKNTQ